MLETKVIAYDIFDEARAEVLALMEVRTCFVAALEQRSALFSSLTDFPELHPVYYSIAGRRSRDNNSRLLAGAG